MNPFLSRIDRGDISSAAALRRLYTAEVKRLHPDLNTESAPGIDFDRLREDYEEALRYLAVRPPSAPAVLADRQAFLDEFRNLAARGFPVNAQAAAKNKAYAASFRKVSAFLGTWSGDPDFFPRANRECRLLKRLSPGDHWYTMQVIYGVTSMPFGAGAVAGQHKVAQRHLDRVRPCLGEEGLSTLLRLLEFLAGDSPGRT